MANISIRKLDDSIKRALQQAAAAQSCSLEEYARRALAAAAAPRGGGALGAVAARQSESNAAAGVTALPAAAALLPVAELGAQERAALQGKTALLIICGSVASYKALEFIRLARAAGLGLSVIMTKAAQHFITPLAVGALAGAPVCTELFAREQEQEIGHIRLARNADMVVVFAASASRMAKMAAGLGDDLAGAALLAARAPLLLAPGMNPAMWAHPATQRNLALLRADGCRIAGPETGEMAESGEAGLGRMSEPAAVLAACAAVLSGQAGAAQAAENAAQTGNLPANAANTAPNSGILRGRHIIVTSGPTHEAIDPVRYLSNYSSGRQGHAIAAALCALGARVSLISGPVSLPDPQGAEVIHVTSAREMEAAALAALPADAAVCVAAVADWRPRFVSANKIKKPRAEEMGRVLVMAKDSMEIAAGQAKLSLVENPDILAEIGHSAARPKLVAGFAAETANLRQNAAAKLAKKGADWIIANDVTRAADGSGVMGGESNEVVIFSAAGEEAWPPMPKAQIAEKLAQKIAAFLTRADGAADTGKNTAEQAEKQD